MNLKYETVIFDFDGTIMDSAPGTIRALKDVINEFGFKMPDQKSLNDFIGPPLRVSFMNTFDISSELADKVVEVYREIFIETDAMMNAYIYEDIVNLLDELNQAGATVAIASAKNEKTLRQTIMRFDLLQYFKAIAGAEPDPTYATKTEIILDCFERLNASTDHAVYIGDTDHDALGAEEANVDFCAVLWGYGFQSLDDVKSHKCRYVAKDVNSLKKFLLPQK